MCTLSLSLSGGQRTESHTPTERFPPSQSSVPGLAWPSSWWHRCSPACRSWHPPTPTAPRSRQLPASGRRGSHRPHTPHGMSPDLSPSHAANPVVLTMARLELHTLGMNELSAPLTLRTYLFGFRLVRSVPVSQPAVVPLPPCVELPVGGNGCTVATPTSNLFHVLALQTLNHLRTVVRPEKHKSLKLESSPFPSLPFPLPPSYFFPFLTCYLRVPVVPAPRPPKRRPCRQQSVPWHAYLQCSQPPSSPRTCSAPPAPWGW